MPENQPTFSVEENTITTDMYFTPGQLSEILEISSSTLNNRAREIEKTFGSVFHKDKNGHRRYTKRDFTMFREIERLITEEKRNPMDATLQASRKFLTLDNPMDQTSIALPTKDQYVLTPEKLKETVLASFEEARKQDQEKIEELTQKVHVLTHMVQKLVENNQQLPPPVSTDEMIESLTQVIKEEFEQLFQFLNEEVEGTIKSVGRGFYFVDA